jgi:hypothetical protein
MFDFKPRQNRRKDSLRTIIYVVRTLLATIIIPNSKRRIWPISTHNITWFQSPNLCILIVSLFSLPYLSSLLGAMIVWLHDEFIIGIYFTFCYGSVHLSCAIRRISRFSYHLGVTILSFNKAFLIKKITGTQVLREPFIEWFESYMNIFWRLNKQFFGTKGVNFKSNTNG